MAAVCMSMIFLFLLLVVVVCLEKGICAPYESWFCSWNIVISVLCLSVCVAGTRPIHITESVWSSPTRRHWCSFILVSMHVSLFESRFVFCVSCVRGCVWVVSRFEFFFLSLSYSAHSVRRDTVPTIHSYIDTSFSLSLSLSSFVISFFLALFSISRSTSLFSLCSIRIVFVLTLLNGSMNYITTPAPPFLHASLRPHCPNRSKQVKG